MKKEYTYGEVLIKASNVGLQYGEKVILRDINFEVKNIIRPGVSQGQVVALIGRSGVGKSQLFRILSGLNKPTTGQVLIDSDQHPVLPGEVGIIPQNYLLFSHRTVYQNLQLGVKNCCTDHSKKTREDMIQKYTEQFELTDHLHKYPGQLSGGQKQRVSIIQQVLTENKFILLDEPLSGLDPVMVEKVTSVLNRISTLNELNTLIIVSHDIENAMAIADVVWILAREKDKDGATITCNYDLKEMGMAWEPDIRHRTDFQQLVGTVKGSI
jgi:ABC-type nitrate/sulfonate/bicarbonate transport system ATPase subunit